MSAATHSAVTPNASFSAEELDSKRLDLIEIEAALRTALRNVCSPRMAQAILIAATVGICLHIALSFLKVPLETHLSFKQDAWSLFVLGFLLPAGVGAFVFRRSNEPRSHEEAINRLLLAYEPVSVQAYRDLQARTGEAGAIHESSLRLWLDEERAALRAAASAVPNSNLPSFVARKV